jgi:hypothetical protein
MEVDMSQKNELISILDQKIRALEERAKKAKQGSDLALEKYNRLHLHLEATKRLRQFELQGNSHPVTKFSAYNDGSAVGEKNKRPSPLRDACLKIVAKAEGPIRVGGVEAKLKEEGVSYGIGSVPVTLRRLSELGAIQKDGYGVYKFVSQAKEVSQ